MSRNPSFTWTEDAEFYALFEGNSPKGVIQMVEVYDLRRPNAPGHTHIRLNGELVFRGECQSFNESDFAPSHRRQSAA